MASSSRKRTLDEFTGTPASPKDPSISFVYQLAYDEELELSQGVRALLQDSNQTPLERLQAAEEFASRFHESKPPSRDSSIWTQFAAIQDPVLECSLSPSTFLGKLPIYVQQNLIEICSDEELGHKSEASQDYYTRFLDITSDEYAQRLEQYGRDDPGELPFVVLQLQYLGFAERAEALYKTVMEGMGYNNVRIDMDHSIDGTHPTLRPQYSGTTHKTPGQRNKDDQTSNGKASRMKKFIQTNADLRWLVVRWISLRCEIANTLDWRTKEEPGQIEAILTDCLRPNYNKARGGWLHQIALSETIARPLRKMFEMLPAARLSDTIPPHLPNELNEMVELEYKLMQKLQDSRDISGIFKGPVVEYLKTEFVDQIRHVNGTATSFTLVREVPNELGNGGINSSWSSDEAGRSVALYQRILQALNTLETGQERNYEAIRQFDGPIMDFWRFPRMHKWWALLVYLTGLYLRHVRPLVIHSWSSQLSNLLDSTALVTTPHELGDILDPMRGGPDAMRAVDVTILDHPQIKQGMTAPRDRNLRENVGTTRKVIFGPGSSDFGLNFVKGHQGSIFYRQMFARHDRRRFTLVHALSVALNRITEDVAATTKSPETQEERLKQLDIINAEFERVKWDSGVGQELRDEVYRQQMCDAGQAALFGKRVEDAAQGEVEEREKKRKRVEFNHPRNNGLLARGEINSVERNEQLEKMRRTDLLAERLGIDAPFLGPDDTRPSSLAYSQWFLNLRPELSLQQSLNAHGRTPAGIQGHLDNGKKLAMHNKDLYSKLRQDRGDAVGSWIQAEQFEEMCIVLPTLELDLSFQSFHNSPRTAVCQDCGERVFGKDRNSTHRCSVDAVRTKISKTSFNKYSRLLHPHHLLDQTDVDGTVHQRVINHFDLKASPALDWVIDANGESTLPFPADIERVTGTVYWKKNEPKHSAVNFHLATDVALRSLAPGDSPLEMAQRAGKTIQPGAEKRFNDDRDKVWTQAYMDKLVRDLVQSDGELDGCICLGCGDVKLECKGASRLRMMTHGPCTRSGNKSHGRNEDNFLWFSPQRLTDLPYSLSTVLLQSSNYIIIIAGHVAYTSASRATRMVHWVHPLCRRQSSIRDVILVIKQLLSKQYDNN